MPGNGKPFEAGNQAGKGHGRPKGSSHVQICRQFADDKGWQKLIDIADGSDKLGSFAPDQKIQFEALKLILAYGFGKPSEHIDISNAGATLFDWLRGEFKPGPNGDSGRGQQA